MKVHANAPLGPKGREFMVRRVIEHGWSLTAAAEAAGVSERTCSKWLARYRSEGRAGLLDRSSAPRSVPHRTDERAVEAIVALRRLRMTPAEIAECLPIALSTISAVLLRVGLGKLSQLEPPEPPNRNQRRHPGELLHIDIKNLGRIPDWGAGHRVHGNKARQRKSTKTNAAGQREATTGWECVHVCVDDATRLAYAEVLPDEKASTAVAFLRRALIFYRRHGIAPQRVMTDNGSAYRSTVHSFACRALGLRHLRTRPYRPRTNGKAERFIRTLLGGWAYGAIYGSSRERTAALDGWLWTYNHRRPHGSLSHQLPIARLNELNNLARSYS
ncbi:IS481 family transposase [Solirubrobacter soli]|uniref:IS481 family transposase n=1 Tax=Solirubrobacter soli TaxID=363832 RepID=UPI0004277E21